MVTAEEVGTPIATINPLKKLRIIIVENRNILKIQIFLIIIINIEKLIIFWDCFFYGVFIRLFLGHGVFGSQLDPVPITTQSILLLWWFELTTGDSKFTLGSLYSNIILLNSGLRRTTLFTDYTTNCTFLTNKFHSIIHFQTYWYPDVLKR